MTTPRPIEPSEIRVGDKVRLSAEIDVQAVDRNMITALHGRTWSLDLYDWTLLDRPEPPREPGSRWRDPETGAEYIVTDIVVNGEAHYCPYVRARQSTGLCAAWSDGDAAIIARLVPLDGTR